ncbi:PREDICTED: cytochrome c oxidase subunit 7C, mitochondrial [Nicrophorus vespilloides]|uniref:Cytochrome c oxidase subunit 7C, mitochondrial n=1 Tax=Nicrophorus vespilloides TaxID=110193 RepID=A0ABM1MUX5_NICVS|nr:PREDICTED: cytochrome c oxidase subunit 7C, mitochondrial [Nicrophorus vespilloides]
MIGKSQLFARKAITQFVRNSGHGGVPGENLPFQITNRYRLTAVMAAFFGLGFSAPFLVVRLQYAKK